VNRISINADDLKPFLPYVAAVVGALMLGWGVGILKASSGPPEIDFTDNWPLPQWSPYQPEMSSQDLTQLKLWGGDTGEAIVEAEPEPVEDWRFIGIVQDGDLRLALVETTADKKLHRMQSGDVLPGNAQIISIGEGQLTISENGEEVILKLFNADNG